MILFLTTQFYQLLQRRFVKFAIVGVIATLLNYAVFYTLFKFAGIDYRLASGIGFFTGVVLGYYFNSRWTFQGSNSSNPNKQFIKYFVVYMFSLCVNVIAIDLIVEYLGIYPSFANLITIVITASTNYIGTKFWVFKKST